MSARVSLMALMLLAGCKPTIQEARKQLEDKDPKKREDGAGALKDLYAKDPKAFGDPGEQFWTDRLAKLQLPTAGLADREKAFETATKGGSTIEADSSVLERDYQLDDFWATRFHFTESVNKAAALDGRKVQSADPPRRHVVHVVVAQPAQYTGAWTTYFVNGAVAQTVDYQGGVKHRERTYWENGQVQRDTTYATDKELVDGKEIQYFRDGGLATESNWKEGKKVGTERTFYETGKLEEEKTFVNNTLDGRVTHYRQDGGKEWCVDYKAGKEVGRGCETPPPSTP
jgi:hypothetical protein